MIALLIVFLILSALFLGPIMDFFYGSWGIGSVHPEKADYSIKRTIEFNNSDPRDLDYYNLTLAIPEDIPENEIQSVDDTYWNIEPRIFRKYNSEWKSWNRSLDANEKESVQIIYDVRTRTVSWDYSGSESGTIDDISSQLKQRYNKNQWPLDEDSNDYDQDYWMIQPEHPAIESLADEIIKNEDNIHDASRAIYDWINENIEYELAGSGLPKPAVKVLESGTGDCDEQSFLYASLSRAAGIPAWMELGVLYDSRGERWGGHGWIRTRFVSEDGSSGWVNIDLVNDQFYFRDALRFTSWVDDGKEGHLEDFYSYITWKGGDLELEDDFENVRMNTEGRVVHEDGWLIPGFKMNIGIPAVITAVLIFSAVKDKE
ncbi:MAG: transglutaminase-like domain-containing protein [Candidatus Natronoplasma sp.]